MAWTRPAPGGWLSSNRVCRHCGQPLPVQPHDGQPRIWCSEACRLRNYRARRTTTR